MTGEISHGGHSYWIEPNTWFTTSNIRIGRYTSISGNVHMDCGAQHRTEWVTTSPLNFHFFGSKEDAFTFGDIEIGSDVSICEGAVIMGGVHIADGAVVAARAVVTKDVPPYAVMAGVPARVVKYRFPEDVIRRLLKLKWWDWPDEKVKERIPLLLSSNVEELLKAEGVE